MCSNFDNPFSNSGNSFFDDVLGMNPQKPVTPGPSPVARQVVRTPTLSGGVNRSTQRRARNETMDKRSKQGAKSSGKAMLAINRAKGFGMVPIGGLGNTGTQSGPMMTGVNYV